MLRSRILLLLLMLTGFILVHLPPRLAAQNTNQAALVVRFGDGNVQKQCVTFSEPEITGYDLLQRSGMDVTVDAQGMGALICRIGGTGCPADDCLCQCKGGDDCVYWSYWHQNGGGWQYSPGGASIYPVTNGTIEGWSWGPGTVDKAVPPPETAFEEICQVAPTPTHTATAVPPTATPLPTNTSPPTEPPEINFSVDANSLQAGACTTLRWRVANILSVYLDGVGVSGEDAQEVCPSQTETYTLRVLYAGGEDTRTLTVNVLPAQTTATPTIGAQVAGNVAAPATAAPPTSNTPSTAPSDPVAASAAADAAASPTPAAINTATTAPPTVTAAVTWITVAPLFTETATPTTVIAALPPTPLNPAPPTPADNQAGVATAVSWLPYVIFLAIVVVLSLLIFRATRRSEAQ
jgi:hypothetical protein